MSGAVLLLPCQVSVLNVRILAPAPTNPPFNVLSTSRLRQIKRVEADPPDNEVSVDDRPVDSRLGCPPL